VALQIPSGDLVVGGAPGHPGGPAPVVNRTKPGVGRILHQRSLGLGYTPRCAAALWLCPKLSTELVGDISDTQFVVLVRAAERRWDAEQVVGSA
jgi:hypothetical protein